MKRFSNEKNPSTVTVFLRRHCYLALLSTLLIGCDDSGNAVKYVCTEPLNSYLDQARVNITNDYEVERSQQLLAVCPDQGYHRRYEFEFDASALLAKRQSDAEVDAKWCNETTSRKVTAELDASTSVLTFSFIYPWATSTGKYPKTKFRIERNSMRGGFFNDIDWQCELAGVNQE
ncbi:hypothetical protein [Congregibacter litoralis]|uniref:Lipoprotein n=1 Tax=Congregibacter litoralis KT71 TaxID=314285 RepID=A4A4U4_9GAMM|nr:hypothetical protein [Congregibacter litoralis]EAQ98815.2 hypothetical protein KT71_09317 [Congregibacter litoralis KT71]